MEAVLADDVFVGVGFVAPEHPVFSEYKACKIAHELSLPFEVAMNQDGTSIA